MNWNTTYGQGVRFAFVRSTRGGLTSDMARVDDTRFLENMGKISTLAANGKVIYAGAYHYGRPDLAAIVGGQPTNTALRTHAENEAQHFYDVAGSYMTAGWLRPVLDLEERGGSTSEDNPDSTALTAAKLSYWANSFMNRIEVLAGTEPLIYMNTSYAQSYVDSTLASRDLWIANWNMTSYGDPVTGTGSPPTGVFGAGNWDFWQYSSTGSGATYGASSTYIDLDVANGDLSYVRSFLVPEPAIAPLLAGLGLLIRRWRGRR